ncbi:hypothetical protein LCGC14_0817860 [marine sediment metagenome]|uniref:Uncharacterized protein n=1 Tax=marine sediment metagenome TaxID=412755 RepID=A0A0F9Q524_9ZZZZ
MRDISSITNKSPFSMQIYNFKLEGWETITFASAILTPMWGIAILIIGMFPLALGLIWRLINSNPNII